MSKRVAICQQFDSTRPLEADEENLYVDWQKNLGLDDVKIRLAQSIALSGTLLVCRLFTGHRGVGKTTELKRVRSGPGWGRQAASRAWAMRRRCRTGMKRGAVPAGVANLPPDRRPPERGQ